MSQKSDGLWKDQALRQRNELRIQGAVIEQLRARLAERDALTMDICRSALSFTRAIRNQENHKAHAYMLELEALVALYCQNTVVDGE